MPCVSAANVELVPPLRHVVSEPCATKRSLTGHYLKGGFHPQAVIWVIRTLHRPAANETSINQCYQCNAFGTFDKLSKAVDNGFVRRFVRSCLASPEPGKTASDKWSEKAGRDGQ